MKISETFYQLLTCFLHIFCTRLGLHCSSIDASRDVCKRFINWSELTNSNFPFFPKRFILFAVVPSNKTPIEAGRDPN